MRALALAPCLLARSQLAARSPGRVTRLMQAAAASDPSSRDVPPLSPVIVGAGIGGLASALALQNAVPRDRLGRITVLERRGPAELREDTAGAGVQLGPNGLRALEAVGGSELAEKWRDGRSSDVEGTAIVTPGGPMFVPDATREDTGLPLTFGRWGALRRMLLDELDGDLVSIVTDSPDVCGYEVDGADGHVTLRTADGRALGERGNLVISAEGIRSTFRLLVNGGRTSIFPDERPGLVAADIKDSGRVNIKAVVPVDMSPEHKRGYQYAWFAPDGGVGCFCGPAGAGSTYWALSIADTVDEGSGEVSRFLPDDAQEDLPAVKESVLERLRGLGTADCDFAIDLVEKTDPGLIYISRGEESSSVGPDLVSSDGKVVLVGDSAHGMSGSYGQNPALALEDAAVLASCVRDRGDDLKGALETYGRRRVERCLEIQRRSAERAARAMRGEEAGEDVSRWIHRWTVEE